MASLLEQELEENVLPEKLIDVLFDQLLKMGKNMKKVITGECSNKKYKFHRENKNRPREISSKIRHVNSATSNVSKVKEQPVRKRAIDPRFSNRYGEFDCRHFEKNYKFLDNIKKKERKLLKKELNKPDIDDEKRQLIQSTITKMENQRREKCRIKKSHSIDEIQRDYYIKEYREGRKPQFLNKKDKKLYDLIEHYEKLKREGGLTKHIKRRRKKLNHRDRKNLGFLNSSKPCIEE